MSTLNDTDLFIIERSGTNYQVRSNEMSTLQDTDLFVVERSGTNYQVEAKDINLGPTGTIEEPVAVLTPLNGAGLNANGTYQPLSSALTAVNAGGDVVYETDTIASVGTSPFAGSGDPPNGTNAGSWANVFDGITCNSSSCGIDTTTTTIWTFDTAVSIGAGDTFEIYSSGASVYADIFGWSYEATPNSFTLLSGNAGIHSSGWGWDTLPIIGDLKCLQIGGSPGFGVTGFRLNGVTLSAGPVLTFPTDNNFDKFEVGDVVQSDWNQSQEWSSSLTGVGLTNPSNAFNGTGDYADSSGGWTLDLSSYTFGTGTHTVSVKTGGASSITVNGTALTDPGGGGAKIWTGSVAGELTTIFSSTTGASLYYVEIDNKLLVDSSVPASSNPNAVSITAIDAAGPTITTDGGSWVGSDGSEVGTWNQSQEWSTTTTPSVTQTQFPYSNAFDGVITGDAGTNGFAGWVSGNGDITITFPADISVSSTIDVYSGDGTGGSTTATVVVGGVSQTSSALSGFVSEKSFTATGNLETVTVTQAGGGARLYGIAIDGKTLVDTSIPGAPGATDISKTVTSDASLVFTSPLELANMVGPLSQVDENGDVKTPVTSEIASVDSNLVVWSNYLTANLSLQDPTNAFNGDTSDGALDFDGAFNTTKTYRLTFTPPTPIAFSSTVELFSPGGPQAPYYNTWRVDLGSGFNTQQPVVQNSWVTVASGGGTLVSLITEASQNGTAINAIRVDGVILQDTVPFGTVLTFNTPNPDLQYFQPGDQIGTESGFAPVTYTGNFDYRGIIGLPFSPSLVWIKDRSSVNRHCIYDVVRGVNKQLSSDLTDAEAALSVALTSFDSNGFSLGPDNYVNQQSNEYIAWCWDAGDTTVTNNDGTIESQVRSNGNFSVVKYTGGGDSVGHGLSNAPSFVIVKSLSTGSWLVGHASAGWSVGGNLDNANSFGASSYWSGTSPDSSVIYLGGDATSSSVDYIAYAWAETPGVSSFGEFTGNGSTTGPVIDCGFEPAFVMVKKSSDGANWYIVDTARDPSNPMTQKLCPNLSGMENDPGAIGTASSNNIQTTPNGFQLITTSAATNGSGDTFIYAAFSGSNPIEVVNVDVAANTMTVDGGDYEVGDTVTGEPLVATAANVDYVDGSTLGVDGVVGTWLAGLYAQGAEITQNAPSPSSIVFTSMNGNTTEFTGTDATLTSRVWTLNQGSSSTGPWSQVGEYVDTAANASQDGATPWAGHPALEANKFYQVKVAYTSDNATSVISTFNTFKTGDAS
jgi:hypothetical protein